MEHKVSKVKTDQFYDVLIASKEDADSIEEEMENTDFCFDDGDDFSSDRGKGDFLKCEEKEKICLSLEQNKFDTVCDEVPIGYLGQETDINAWNDAPPKQIERYKKAGATFKYSEKHSVFPLINFDNSVSKLWTEIANNLKEGKGPLVLGDYFMQCISNPHLLIFALAFSGLP